MATTTNQLVLSAYQMLNIKDQSQDLSSYELNKGLQYLNEIVGQLSGNDITIGYYTDLVFPIVVGKNDYIVKPTGGDIDSNPLVNIAYCRLAFNGANWPVTVVNRDTFFNTAQYNTVQGLPRKVINTRQIGQSTLLFYPIPDQAYTATVSGKQTITEFTAEQTINQVPNTYIRYLRYELASELANSYPMAVWTPKLEQNRQEITQAVMVDNDLDISLEQTDALRHTTNQYFGPYLGVID